MGERSLNVWGQETGSPPARVWPQVSELKNLASNWRGHTLTGEPHPPHDAASFWRNGQLPVQSKNHTRARACRILLGQKARALSAQVRRIVGPPGRSIIGQGRVN